MTGKEIRTTPGGVSYQIAWEPYRDGRFAQMWYHDDMGAYSRSVSLFIRNGQYPDGYGAYERLDKAIDESFSCKLV
jgi:hypothetical protein